MTREMRDRIEAIAGAALQAADPRASVARALRVDGDRLLLADRLDSIPIPVGVWILALGKAAIPMAEAALGALGARVRGGVAAVPAYAEARSLSGISIHRGGHPLPDAGTIEAGLAVAEMLGRVPLEGVVLALLSGGGSSVMEIPRRGVDLATLRAVTEGLLHSGAAIEEINAVRCSLSESKGGGLLAMTRAGTVASLAMSDVIDDPPHLIASGPTVPWSPAIEDVREILARRLPDSIVRALPDLSSRRMASSGLPSHPYHIVGCNRLAVFAARDGAERLGFNAEVRTTSMRGEARDAGRRIAREILRTGETLAGPRPACLLYGGETTVTVRGHGRGGRNLELALGAAEVLDGSAGVALLSFATDGKDGSTDAAGAIVDGDTARRIRDAGGSIEEALRDSDSEPALRAADALWITGPTGTNVNDVTIAIGWPRA